TTSSACSTAAVTWIDVASAGESTRSSVSTRAGPLSGDAAPSLRRISQDDMTLSPFREENPMIVRRRVASFTLIELLVVTALVAVRISVVVTAVQSAREGSRRNQCPNNPKRSAIDLHEYRDAVGTFPMGYVAGSRCPAPG